LSYLSQREHSRFELERKLLRHLQKDLHRQAQARAEAGAGAGAGADTDGRENDASAHLAAARQQLDALLTSLDEQGWLSDTRAAESLLRTQSARSGHMRLKQQLQAKGLSSDLVGPSLKQLRDTEPERALALWRKRFGAQPTDHKEFARQARFLASRGFEGDTIRQILQQRYREDS
jgi:regulatory protein